MGRIGVIIWLMPMNLQVIMTYLDPGFPLLVLGDVSYEYVGQNLKKERTSKGQVVFRVED